MSAVLAPIATHRMLTLMPWKTITFGGGVLDWLIREVRGATGFVPDLELDAMNKMSMSKTEEEADLVLLTPRELGFVSGSRLARLLDPRYLEAWSRRNLDDQIVELCPADLGPHLRFQYLDQPKGEVLWIAMTPVPCTNGNSRIFYVWRDEVGDKGRKSLGTMPVNFDVSPHILVENHDLDRKYVFRLRDLRKV